jgi:hypothetical protein
MKWMMMEEEDPFAGIELQLQRIEFEPGDILRASLSLELLRPATNAAAVCVLFQGGPMLSIFFHSILFIQTKT